MHRKAFSGQAPPPKPLTVLIIKTPSWVYRVGIWRGRGKEGSGEEEGMGYPMFENRS